MNWERLAQLATAYGKDLDDEVSVTVKCCDGRFAALVLTTSETEVQGEFSLVDNNIGTPILRVVLEDETTYISASGSNIFRVLWC